MSVETNDEQDRAREREAFIAGMKSRMEQAQASGQSPEEIRKLAGAFAREESRRQMPQIVSRARSWWSGFRNFLIVGALALVLAIGLALFVEHRYAAPLCERYGALHELTYKGLDYPVIGRSSSTTSASGSCMFDNRAGRRTTVSLNKLESNWAVALLVSFALQLSFTAPVAFVLVALVAVGIGKMRWKK